MSTWSIVFQCVCWTVIIVCWAYIIITKRKTKKNREEAEEVNFHQINA